MAENDIYDNETKYRRFLKDLDIYCKKPSSTDKKRQYWIKNPVNKKYFIKLGQYFDGKDTSFVHRVRTFQSMKMLCYAINKDLKDCTREDITQILTFMHSKYKSIKSKSKFISTIKYVWRVLFPVLDERGEIDEKQYPYEVRHLEIKIDRSKEKRKDDKFSMEEFQNIVTFFSEDIRMQAYLTLAFESLGRPQEILYTRILDVKCETNYARIWISSHGKEGVGFLQVIDAYPYLQRWLDKHPLKGQPEAFLFVNLEGKNRFRQMSPFNIDKKIKNACRILKINKPITCYSLKRNGVTYRRLRGDQDVEIQHAARWSSTKQLKTYDQSDQEEAFKLALIKKGLIPATEDKYRKFQPATRECLFCGEKGNAFTDSFCIKCHRLLDRSEIKKEIENRENKIENMSAEIEELKSILSKVVQGLEAKEQDG